MNKAMLIIMDGFGLNPSDKGNAVKAANTPNLDRFFQEYPHTKLNTYGKEVGLPEGIMGNSEVGHLNIGAGRIVYQLNTLIDHKIETGEFYQNSALLNAIHHARENNSDLHLFGLISDGGVHSSLTHLWALLDLCKQQEMDRVFIHCFMDGRDTLPHSGIDFIRQLIEKTREKGVGQIATIMGRYYAMDRDNRWERVEKAWKAMAEGVGEYFTDPLQAMQSSYDQNVTDEFVLPKIMVKDENPISLVKDNDSIIFFNFRSDRAREITRTFIFEDFSDFPVKHFKNLKYINMTEYDIRFKDLVEVAFTNEKLENILGKVFEDHKIHQLRLAETEKYAHVTFFFNGGVEKPFEYEDRILIPSPKVPSYDLQPEMSAFTVRDKCLEALDSGLYEAIIMNFANCDMVGHTGVFEAAVKAVETVDQCVGEIVKKALEKDYRILITADHGNAEQMIDANGNIMTAHSLNQVPLLVLTPDHELINLQEGRLADISPTLLKLMNIEKPIEMTGKELF